MDLNFMGIGFFEILFVLVVALLVIGPRRFPEIARTLGEAVRRVKMAAAELTRSIDEEVNLETKKAREDVQEIHVEASDEMTSVADDPVPTSPVPQSIPPNNIRNQGVRDQQDFDSETNATKM